MMQNIIISSISGLTPPYQIFVCDFLGNNCQLVDVITSTVPPIEVIPLPDFFSGAPAVSLKIIETNVPCEKNIPVVCSYFGNVLFTFCKCSDLSECLYTEINPLLRFGQVVSLNEYPECWQFSGYQFTNEIGEELTVNGVPYESCQECYDIVAPSYFSACCSNYTFTFDESFQSTFNPNISWFVNIPQSTGGNGSGYTGCTVVISNYITPDQTYVESDWNYTTNTNSSAIFPFPIMKSCSDCTEVNPC
jgi:hypothetical protein